MTKICITPFVQGTGGMASFRLKFEQGLTSRGIDVTHDLNESADAVLVIAGTRNLAGLWRARRRGIRIVQRLDGVNWVQRVKWSGVKYTVRAEYGNLMLAFIRNNFADHVIYQSQFIRNGGRIGTARRRLPPRSSSTAWICRPIRPRAKATDPTR